MTDSSEPTSADSVGVDISADVDDSVSDRDLEQAAAAVEADIDLATVVAERDDYLDALRRVQADFENFKKQNIRRNTELVERAAETMVAKLLPVLDAFDGALAHGADDVKPIYDLLMDSLEKEGLTLVYPLGEAFDPARMEAVAHEATDDGTGDHVVAEVLRSGYLWKGRVLRPAMVKVKG